MRAARARDLESPHDTGAITAIAWGPTPASTATNTIAVNGMATAVNATHNKGHFS